MQITEGSPQTVIHIKLKYIQHISLKIVAFVVKLDVVSLALITIQSKHAERRYYDDLPYILIIMLIFKKINDEDYRNSLSNSIWDIISSSNSSSAIFVCVGHSSQIAAAAIVVIKIVVEVVMMVAP
jgi:hypothetical protein